MFDFLKKTKKAPRWDKLSFNQKKLVMQKFRNFVQQGPRYKVVSGIDQYQRDQSLVETQNEDFYLNANRRGRLLDLTRNLCRNSSVFNGILLQFKQNVIGTKGGKILLNSPDEELNKELKRLFSDFTRNSDFFDGYSFNYLLKIILSEYIVGGDCVLLFDDGLIEDSGKLLVYESDEIGNVSSDDLSRHYGKYATQSLGKVYNRNGRFCGVTVSRSQRGSNIFNSEGTYFLKKDPDSLPFDNIWMMPANTWRSGQGRGTSPFASAVGAITDVEDVANFELQATKKNAQTFATVYSEREDNSEAVLPSAFDSETDFASMTDEEIEEAIKNEGKNDEQTMTLDVARSAGITYQSMPDGYKMELLDSKHPNSNITDFISYMSGKAAAAFGLSRNSILGNAEDSNYRSQLLAQFPTFLQLQKMLEQVCDWVFYRYLIWCEKQGRFDMKKLPEGFMRFVDWSWPVAEELDEVQHQTAIQMKLQNLTGSLQDALGSDWREKLEQIKDEIKWCESNGIPHPSFKLLSGGQAAEVEVAMENAAEN